jgi:hypothetical protein
MTSHEIRVTSPWEKGVLPRNSQPGPAGTKIRNPKIPYSVRVYSQF